MAKKAINLSADVSVINTILYNKSDGQSNVLKRNFTARPGAGLTISYLNREHKGFQGCNISLAFGQYYQSTKADNQATKYSVSSTTYSDLRYLRLPVEARFGLGRFKKKWGPYLCVGAYAGWLLKYEEHAHADYQNLLVYRYDVTVSDKTINESVAVTNGRGGGDNAIGIKQEIYHSLDYGIQLAAGTDYQINKHLFAGIRLQVSYGIPDIERKGSMEYTDPTNRPDLAFPDDSYWDYNTPKGAYNANNPTNRTATHILATGLQLSIGYNL